MARPWPGFTKIQRYGAIFQRVSTCFNVFQRVSTCFNVFQRVSTCFNVFQRVSTCFNVFVISCHMSDICLVLTCTRHFNFHPAPFIWIMSMCGSSFHGLMSCSCVRPR